MCRVFVCEREFINGEKLLLAVSHWFLAKWTIEHRSCLTCFFLCYEFCVCVCVCVQKKRNCQFCTRNANYLDINAHNTYLITFFFLLFQTNKKTNLKIFPFFFVCLLNFSNVIRLSRTPFTVCICASMRNLFY